MILSGDTIKKLIANGELIKTEGVAYDPNQKRDVNAKELVLSHVGADNLDIRLGHGFKQIDTSRCDHLEIGGSYNYKEMNEIDGGGIYLHPGEFCLGTSDEYLMLPDDVMAMVDSRSSVGRMGLVIQTAAFIHAGFKGRITLELKNEAAVPILLRPYDMVGQLIFMRLDAGTTTPYSGVYQGQSETTSPNMAKC
ncbi:MAG: dCTP deaminase [Candidatus Saccharibacteria bacterium]|nr:dCTP deaminase [Candidatus Saccharibacteria bacterium]